MTALILLINPTDPMVVSGSTLNRTAALSVAESEARVGVSLGLMEIAEYTGSSTSRHVLDKRCPTSLGKSSRISMRPSRRYEIVSSAP